LGATKIVLSNRTRKKAEDLKKIYDDLEIKLNYTGIGTNKLFYDIIYNPSKTKFLLNAKQLGNKTENGKMMFIFQAQLAFKIWHGFLPKINNEVIKLLDL
jgi:shikimate dehydrogenase